MKKTTLSERLAFIAEDVQKVFNGLPEQVLNLPVEDDTPLRTILSNIEIASNENDSEPDSWRRPSNWDGEKTQNFLKEICMEEQMLRQLIMTMPLPMIHDLLEERKQEALKPKKPIEFVAYMMLNMLSEPNKCIMPEDKPSAFSEIKVIKRMGNYQYDLMLCTKANGDFYIMIGHFNDGVVE